MEWDFENGLSGDLVAIPIVPTQGDDKIEYHRSDTVMKVSHRPHKKRMKAIKPAEPAESDPGWAELALKYLQYAKKLALHSSIPITNIRQLPSITHMIAISPENGLDESPWRWCDAYHAIKYLKDHGMVTTSRGAKGTSIKDEHSTVDDLITQLQVQTQEVNQQGEFKLKKSCSRHNAEVHVAIEQMPGRLEAVEFNMQIGDVVSEAHLYERIKLLFLGTDRSDEVPTSTEDIKLRLLGYADKQSGEYIHANMFTSISELIQDADEIRVAVV